MGMFSDWYFSSSDEYVAVKPSERKINMRGIHMPEPCAVFAEPRACACCKIKFNQSSILNIHDFPNLNLCDDCLPNRTIEGVEYEIMELHQIHKVIIWKG